MEHKSVLKEAVQKYLSLKKGEVVIDATLGLGGHALEILKAIGEKGKLIAFELDEENLKEAQKRLKDHEKQIIYIKDNFRYLKTRITGQVDAILFDLGLSSPHVDDSSRGFSFLKEGPLDMRYSRETGLTAQDVINTYPEQELMRIFYQYGEEQFGRKIARAICDRRKIEKFTSTTQLAKFLEEVVPSKFPWKKAKIHPATKVFQALRIEVNDELNALKEALEQSAEVLKKAGRIVVISYHSLEDRIVKQFFKNLQFPPVKSEEENLYSVHGEPIAKILTKKPVVPEEQEIAENPRSRSAKLRAAEKL